MPKNHNIMGEKKQDKVYEVQVKKLVGYKPPGYHMAKFRDAGEFTTLEYTKNKVQTHIEKLSKTHYRNLRTGEIKEYEKKTESERFKGRMQTLKRTFDELKAVIRANFTEQEKALFITLTYKENMEDSKQLMKDFDVFMKRLRYALPKHKFEYVAVMEPQGRGAWHVHLMLKTTNHDKLFIADKLVRKKWGKGITDTQQLKSDDVGRYYTAYFTGLMVNDDDISEGITSSEDIFEMEQDIVENENASKAYVKGARLHRYPKHFKFYRCSQGIVKPQKHDAIIGIMEDDSTKLECEKAFEVQKVFLEDCGENKKGDIVFLNKVYKATYRRKTDKKLEELYNWEDNMVVKAKKNIQMTLAAC